MSRMTYLEAIEYVLAAEMEARLELIVLRPGARPALEESERDVALPRMSRNSFSVALGASMAGMHSVLDLRQESACAEMLMEAVCALPADASPEMTILTGAEEAAMLMELPGVMVLQPKTPRQAAGFARAALRSSRLTLLIADQALAGEEDEIPEEADFMMLPLDGTEETPDAEEETKPAEETAAEVCDEPAEEMPADFYEEPAEEASAETEDDTGDESAPEPGAAEEHTEEIEENADELDEAADAAEEPAEIPSEACQEEQAPHEAEEPEEAPYSGTDEEQAAETEKPTAHRFCSSRMTPIELARLHALAGLLGMPAETLAGRCTEHAMKRTASFGFVFEPEAEPGECACLAPGHENALVWLGNDRLTVSYDADSLSHAQAGAMLRAVKRVLETPELLIYDKECEGE